MPCSVGAPVFRRRARETLQRVLAAARLRRLPIGLNGGAVAVIVHAPLLTEARPCFVFQWHAACVGRQHTGSQIRLRVSLVHSGTSERRRDL